MSAVLPLSYWEDRFTSYLLSLHSHTDGAHDLGHLRRVWKTALHLHNMDAGKSDALVLMAACFFHDLVSLAKNDPQRALSSRYSATATATLLNDHLDGFPKDKIDGVCHAIEAHSFSAGIMPETDDAKIVQDADRMEALGAIGIARTFYTGGRMNSLLFNEEDPLAVHRALNDTRYALDHFR
jgi:uncharacterized protein